jgi:phosphatidate cytidylyltransferase
VSRRDSDGDDTATSGDDEFSAEDEFREWAEETEEGPAEEAAPAQGWMGRVFGRKPKATESERSVGPDHNPNLMPVPEADPTDLEDPDPGELGIFSAIVPEDGPPLSSADDEPLDDPDSESVAEEPFDIAEDAESVDGRDEEPAYEPAEELTLDLDSAEGPVDEPADEAESAPGAVAPTPTGAAGTPSFSELWGDEGSEMPEFTSDDYLQATTREYAGLAEAVARAEQEGTQQIAVSAEIPGLESGLVGLDDVVSAEGDMSADVIEPPASSDLPMRFLTAVGLLIVFAASLLTPYGIGALIFVVLLIAAGEMFAALIRGGYRPLSIFGFLGVAGAFLGTWMAGPVAVPIALLLTAVAVLLFYATVPGRRAALENASLTIMVTAWIGGLGAFAFDLLQSNDYVWLVLGLVVTVAAMDVGQYFIGRRLGRRQLAPIVSPKKTVEGYVAGIIVAIAVGAAFAWAPPFEMTDGLLIGAVVAIVSPLGDLAVSVIKRALGVKDMGYILPGHGGVLDRVDAMIITIPAIWIAYSWMGLIN